ncbi:hypothetical protein CURE108131_21560 [Cupriavidus respiraculi]|uniref:Uncharacterized protein n=1 Tax=Cupriavidus respiraculi TaxID=195930 RepID=A0ABM8X441_9BURK|nr:hypothetical protein [Cupriavidus respiraculi]MBY4945997.1 hypothetical protein [Cupriavidus respiraculi]CAG9174679.1 hypothetical protein LMG21510_02670 [Cupriavidus respiraculi]
MIGWLRKIFPGAGAASAGNKVTEPTGPFIVNLIDDSVVVHRPDGQREEVALDQLDRLVVRVSNREPWAGPAWLILAGIVDEQGHQQGCVVPLDAMNHEALLARLQALPGFNQQKLDNALRDARQGKSRSDAILWKRGVPAEDTAADAAGADTAKPAAHDDGQH